MRERRKRKRRRQQQNNNNEEERGGRINRRRSQGEDYNNRRREIEREENDMHHGMDYELEEPTLPENITFKMEGRNRSVFKDKVSFFINVENLINNQQGTRREIHTAVMSIMEQLQELNEETPHIYIALLDHALVSKTMEKLIPIILEKQSENSLLWFFKTLENNYFRILKSQNGSYVLQTLLKMIPQYVKNHPESAEKGGSVQEIIQRIQQELKNKWVEIVEHKSGSQVARTIMETLINIKKNGECNSILKHIINEDTDQMKQHLKNPNMGGFIAHLMTLDIYKEEIYKDIIHMLFGYKNGKIEKEAYENIKTLMNHPVGCHIYEAAIDSLVDANMLEMHENIYYNLLQGKLNDLVRTKYGKYVVCALIHSPMINEQLCMSIYDEFINFMKICWETKFVKPITYMTVQLAHFNVEKEQNHLIKLIKEYLQNDEESLDENKKTAPYSWIGLLFEPITTQQARNKQEFNKLKKKVDMYRHQSSLFIELMGFKSRSVVSLFVNYFTHFIFNDVETLIIFSTHKQGSLIMEQFFNAILKEMDTKKTLRKCLRKFIPILDKMIVDKFGARVIDNCLSYCDPKMMLEYANELISKETKLKHNKYARILFSKHHLSKFKKNEKEWVEKASKKSKLKDMFEDIMNEDKREVNVKKEEHQQKRVRKRNEQHVDAFTMYKLENEMKSRPTKRKKQNRRSYNRQQPHWLK
mmetsp:Transcript_10549/g.15421  ORF Transcript_10549/g.15421 Transcript_10549/m.15421 type:complete len:700 (-) Transcript_10549:1920-4019(-)